MNPMDLKRGIDKAVAATIERAQEALKPCSTNKESPRSAPSPPTATTSATSSPNAMEKVGKEGVITVEDGQNR